MTGWNHSVVPVSAIVCLAVCLPGSAGEVHFRRHDVNLESTFPAAAAIDVNRDGRLDIVSGGAWYEGPHWTRHFLREVQEIRGRYDDYSNLPIDVNGDGLTDLISANYRSESIFWIEQPSDPAAQAGWVTRRVDTPGPMETGRLADVNGDGRLDLLPAGTQFAAWWSITQPSSMAPGQPAEPVWTRHDLPPQLIGHGIGFGDIDGDGRGDLVGVGGWAKRLPSSSAASDAGPEDLSRWEWRDEFQLHRDASIPILVHDVDGDGDADLVWGRGHRTGLYWLEQSPGAGERNWQLHAIDTEWSQFHSLLLADLDGDERPEVVAGKRYLGHDGKDVGEFDPMIVACYQFLPQDRVWRRTILDWGSRAGFDLDPKAVDLDADGDVDLLCPTRGGLCWLENQTGVRAGDGEPGSGIDPAAPVAYVDHTDLTVVLNSPGGVRPTATRDDVGMRRAHILAGMQQVMGRLPGPEFRVPLESTFAGETYEGEGHVRQKVSFAVAPGERAVAWLLVPDRTEGRRPAMLCLHQTTRIGKDEPAGLGPRPQLHYAAELARRGYVCLAPDYPSFGEDDFDFVAARGRWSSGTMKALWNNLRAVDFLETLPQVDPERMGVIGHSLGGHQALFTAAFDQRLSAVVTSCGFTAFGDYRGGDLTAWSQPRYMPRVATEYGNDPARMPFDFHEVLAAIAPRAVFVNAPLHDDNFANSGVQSVVAAVQPVYEQMRSRDGQELVLEVPDCGHDFPDDVRTRAYEWLDRVLD